MKTAGRRRGEHGRFRAKGAEARKKLEEFLPRMTRIPTDGIRATSGGLVWSEFPRLPLSVSIGGIRGSNSWEDSSCGFGEVASLRYRTVRSFGRQWHVVQSTRRWRHGVRSHGISIPGWLISATFKRWIVMARVTHPLAGVVGWWVEPDGGRTIRVIHVRSHDVGRIAPLDDGWSPEVISSGPEIFRRPVIGPAVVGVAVAAVIFAIGRAYAACELCGCSDGENSSPDDRFFHSSNMRLNCAGILRSIGLSVKSRCLFINMLKLFINRLKCVFFRSSVKITVR